MKKTSYNNKLIIGWKEWCALPDLGLSLVRAKIDTGAKTSALHAFDIKLFKRQRREFVRFKVHTRQMEEGEFMECHAPLIDVRHVMSSNGLKEARPVIKTTLQLGEKSWEIELTLSNRDPLKFRMLLGREALKSHVIIMPARGFVQDKP